MLTYWNTRRNKYENFFWNSGRSYESCEGVLYRCAACLLLSRECCPVCEEEAWLVSLFLSLPPSSVSWDRSLIQMQYLTEEERHLSSSPTASYRTQQ